MADGANNYDLTPYAAPEVVTLLVAALSRFGGKEYTPRLGFHTEPGATNGTPFFEVGTTTSRFAYISGQEHVVDFSGSGIAGLAAVNEGAGAGLLRCIRLNIDDAAPWQSGTPSSLISCWIPLYSISTVWLKIFDSSGFDTIGA